MLDKHLACPQCGYDLHGIPEERCPECGFGYDAAALRSMAATLEWTRLAVARVVITRGAIAIGLMMPSVCDRVGVSGWTQFFVVAVTYVAAFSTWVIFSEAYQSLNDVPNLLTLFVAIAVAMEFFLLDYPGLALLGGIVTLALAWLVRLRDWPALPPLENTGDKEVRHSCVRYSLGGTSVLVVASLLVLIAWVW